MGRSAAFSQTQPRAAGGGFCGETRWPQPRCGWNTGCVFTQLKQHHAGHYQCISPAAQWSQGISRWLNARTLTVTTNGFLFSFHGFDKQRVLPVTERLYRVSHTVSLWLASLGFPLAAAASVYVVWRERHTPMNRAVFWYSVLVALTMAAVAVYHGWWGLIGLRLWA